MSGDLTGLCLCMHRQTLGKAQGCAQCLSKAQGNEPSSSYVILLVLSKCKDLTKIMRVKCAMCVKRVVRVKHVALLKMIS